MAIEVGSTTYHRGYDAGCEDTKKRVVRDGG